MVNNIKEKKIGKRFLTYGVVSIASFIINSAFTTNFSIMLVLTVIQILILAKFFFSGQDTQYISYYIIFLASSMESANFVGTDYFYGFKNFKLVGINIGVLCILPLFFKFFLSGNLFNYFRKSKGYVKKFSLVISIFTMLAIMLGLINILFNDNGVSNNANVISTFIDACYIFIYSSICFLVLLCVIEKNNRETSEIKDALISTFLGLMASLIFSFLTQNYGNRGGLDSLQVTNLVMLVPFALLLPFYTESRHRVNTLYITTSAIGLLLALYYNTNGKMIMFVLLIPFLMGVQLWKNRKIGLLLSILLLLPVLLYVPFAFITDIGSTSRLLTVKIDQAISMLSIWKPNWLLTMDASPRARIAEFLNIWIEFYKKPYYLFTGKGYMGTIRDHLGMFGPQSLSGFSLLQWKQGAFYVLHGSFNMIFLVYGLPGLIFYIYFAKVVFTKYHLSPWILIGGFWFLIFYGYSITITIFGATCLIIGLYDLDRKYDVQKKLLNEV